MPIAAPPLPRRSSASIKIGVLTFHRCINYGSYWQAHCLVEGLRRRGYDAVLIDHHSPRVNRAEWRCALAPAPPSRADRALYSRKVRAFRKAIAALPLSEPLPLDDPAGMDRYDLVIVGSDEVWNLRHPWYGRHPVFFGEGVRARRVVSYAASFGNYDASEGLDAEWARKLRRFSAISVRDENSRALIEAALAYAPTVVLDPCLQFPDVAATSPAGRSGYAAVYGHSFPDWLAHALHAWARERRLSLVSIGYANPWADEQRIEAGPEEFAGLIAGAEAVATNFFHGCIFALLSARPFVCIPSDYRLNKVRALTSSLGAEERLVTKETVDALPELLARPAGADVARRVDAMRARSERYLDHVLA